MYQVEIERVFKATHAIRLYDGTLEEPHEHDWRLVVEVEAAELDAIEVVMDFHELEATVERAVEPLRGQDLNRLPQFFDVNPTAERVVERIFRTIAAELPSRVKLTRATITEAPGCRSVFWE